MDDNDCVVAHSGDALDLRNQQRLKRKETKAKYRTNDPPFHHKSKSFLSPMFPTTTS